MWTANAAKSGQCLPACTKRNTKALQIETDWSAVPSQPIGRGERTVLIQCLALGPAIAEMKFLLAHWPLCTSLILSQGPQAQQEYEPFPALYCPSAKWDSATHVSHLTSSAMKCPWNPTYSIPWCDSCKQVKRLPMHRSGASSSLLEHLASLWRLDFSYWHLHGRST